MTIIEHVPSEAQQTDFKPESLVKRGLEIYSGTKVLPGFDNFIGQEMALKQIKLAINSAKNRGARLDHCLLASGLAGIGKTTLAMHIAYEMGVGFVEASGKIDAEDFQRLLIGMQDGDILFIDEVHSMGKGNSSAWILPLMQDQKLLTPTGPIEVADICVVAATTDTGKLSEALLSRFPLKPRLRGYTVDEAAEIAEMFALSMDVDSITYTQCVQVAEAASMNPRSIRNLITVARDLHSVNGEIDMDLLYELTGVTYDGLSAQMQDYLKALSTCTNMTASASTICSKIGEVGNLDHIEKDLISRGFIEVQARGRRMTVAGYKRVQELV